VPVKAIKAEFAFDGSRMTLHVQPHDEKQEDLDLSALCESVGREFKTHAGPRRIGPRDASQLQGGHGLCGGEKCCTLVGVGQVSIDMAKQQNIAMNQPDAIGLCGRLRCCLRFEAPVYKAARADHPKVGAVVKTPQGQGEVVGIDVLAEVLTIAVGNPEERVTVKMLLTELEQLDPDVCPRCGKQGEKEKPAASEPADEKDA
jgi:cell fate regulator YaaT (PSP1 superfamily)